MGNRFVFAFLAVLLVAKSSGQNLKVSKENEHYKVAVESVNGETLLKIPDNGLWAVAVGWEDRWMADWHYGNPSTLEKVNGFTILSGKIKLPSGDVLIRDAYKEEKGRIKCIRRFQWMGRDTLKNATMGIQFLADGKGNKVFMPGILYYGNPSGEKSGRTPVYHGSDGDFALFEEHRFPMPFVSFEWGEKNLQGAALHSLPSTTPYANLDDQWWSLGVQTVKEGTLLSLLSGPCGTNEKKSVIKTHQGKRRSMFTEYDDAYLNIPPNGIIEKEFYLQVYPVEEEGSGFQEAIHTAIDIFNPSLHGLPSFESIVKNKYSLAKARWLKGDGYAGFNQFDNQLEDNLEYIVLGWVGQGAAPGYAFQQLQPILNDAVSLQMAQESLDFLTTANFYEEGIYTWYDVKNQKWGPRIWKENPELLSQGQAMYNIANAIKASKKSGLNPEKWKQFLQKACEFHTKRILSKEWSPNSTDEAFFIAPLAMAADLLQNNSFKQAALKAGEHYANRHYTMEEVYWGGTLDATCEDKEGAFGALKGFLALYELTEDSNYLKYAQHAADIVVSYTYLWDVDLPAGRLRDHNFKTRGWTAVSVQNMHIDVYGVLIAPFLYKLGKLTNDHSLMQLAKLMFVSCGQLIDPYGSQGEQPQQTNYTQNQTAPNDFRSYRGNYVEDWTVFWITAHFLNGAALFADMNVDFTEH